METTAQKLEARPLHHVMKDILEVVEAETQVLTEMITANVDETGEDASFTIVCNLKSDKEGALSFNIEPKAMLKRPRISKAVKIQDKQLTLSY